MGPDDIAQPAPSLVRPTWVRYQVLAAACSLAVLTYVQRQGFLANTKFIKEDLGLNSKQIGYMVSIWLLAYGLFQVPGGLLGDRLGARHVLTILVLGWSLLVGLVALTVNLPSGSWQVFAALLALRFLFGAFQAGGFPILARVIADWMPVRQRGFAQGMNWTFTRLGGALAPLLVLWLTKQVFGHWTTSLWVLTGLGVVWCAVFWPWFRNQPTEKPEVNAAERDLIMSGLPVSNVVIAPVSWSLFLRSRSAWGLCLMYGFVGFAGNFITQLLPDYLSNHRHLNDADAALLFGLPPACSIASCLFGGTLSDWLIRRTGSRKWGRRLVGVPTLTLAGLACLLPIWAKEVWVLGFAFSAWFFFSDGMLGPAWASCADVGERYAGTLSGAMNMTGAFLGAVGMALAGWLLDQGKYEVMFLIFACSYGLAALCWLAVDVTRPLIPIDRPCA
jgi:MFS transporter, ACS family, glucarate transporter